ncbi:hypothetical protein O181_000064 [Austropuccinia psidii MF-1]|uniref:Reverse transcriptase Ty1/copia-type domain-containing protein n=1 Tax=Austropuccinia psidii MF-1 TaxID=1389203 RepID=A0A9Q3B7Y3_9BASI|nr:hypothetical protein [Austropuccinia psidii MF-1]
MSEGKVEGHVQSGVGEMLVRDVWEAVDRDKTMKAIGNCWVFDIKHHANGTIKKFKANFLAQGNRQRPGVDCTKTYTPTASLMSLQLVLAHAACNQWTLVSFNVSGAYLHSLVKETVLVEPPIQFWPHLKGKVLCLKKTLYGMRQAGWCWWIFLSDILTQMGFAAIEVDQSLYVFSSVGTVIKIWIHVDDGSIASNSALAVADFKRWLCMEVDIKWHDMVSQIVGLECAFGKAEVAIAQKRLMASILEAYPWRIVKHDLPLPVLSMVNSALEGNLLVPTPFCSVIGSLAYLVSGS